MVKLSDALRGAADRAPLDGTSLSASAAARRVSLNRATRGAATGIVGVTAVGVLALGIFGPGGITSADDASAMEYSAAAADMPSQEGSDGASGDRFNSADGTFFDGAVCGGTAGPPSSVTDSTLTLTADVPAAVDPGAPLAVATVASVLPGVDVDASATSQLEYATTTAEAYVTWNGIVVATAPHVPVVTQGPADEPMVNTEAELTRFTAAPGASQKFVTDMPLENCWDGEPLPAGEYQVVVSQKFYEVLVSPELDVGAEIKLYADSMPTELTITGDPAKDPFAQYLDLGDSPEIPPTEPPVDLPGLQPLPELEPLPDGTLTADVARQLYAAGLTDERWDMAPGTQRWLLTNDSTVEYNDSTWRKTYFGCPMDGATDGRFPERSATIDLVTIDGSMPSRIGVSYGWVVDGNPEFTLTARNVSDYTMGDFAQPLNSQLYLVDRGKVVAEAYGVDPEPNRDIVMFGTDGDMSTERAAQAEDQGLAMAIAPEHSLAAPFAPDDSISSTFLWRDVSGCWDGNRQSTLDTGTYTLVSMQYVSVGAGREYALEQDTPFGEDQPAIGIAPDPYESVDLQVWTSLGNISVD